MARNTLVGMEAAARGLAVVFAAGVAFLSLASTASAATFVVAPGSPDAADPFPANGVCESAAGCTLRAAIQSANGSPGPDTVSVPAGTFTLTGSAGEDAAASGDLDVTDAGTTVQGTGGRATVISGGGIDRVFDVFGQGATISGVTITGGVPFGDVSGGIRVDFTGSLTLADSTVRANAADGSGGGLGNYGALSVLRSTVSGNSVSGGTPGGGGVASSGTTTIENSTIAQNTATGAGAAAGGGIQADGGSVSIRNSTVAANSASGSGSNGGNLDAIDSGNIALRGTIVTGGTATTGSNCGKGTGGTFTSQGGNLEAPTLQCGLSAGAGDLLTFDARLGPLGDNGGPTNTIGLLLGSPAKDSLTGGCPPPDTDQRGEARPIGRACDIGSFEAFPECRGRAPTIVGTEGADVLKGTPKADVILARGGGDKVFARGGADRVCGGPGGDKLVGNGGVDRMKGEEGNDRLSGNRGGDRLSGGPGRDVLKGGRGKDRLKGGAGRDVEKQ